MAKRTNEEFLEEVTKMYGDEYTFLEPYKTSKIKIRVRHNKCHHIYTVSPYHFLTGEKCPLCSRKKGGQKISMGLSGFKERLNFIYPKEYRVLGDYKNNRTKIKVKHIVCGTVFDVLPSNILAGHGCNVCAQKVRDNKRKLSNAEFVSRVKSLVGDEYVFLDPYRNNAHELLRVKHNKCGCIYKVRPYNFIYNNRRCPVCKSSIGESYVKNYLDKNHIDYVPQKMFAGCIDERPLSYDFYLPTKNVLIEYQGIQHYKAVKFFNADYFQTQKKHDGIKRRYAMDNGIHLMEIPYTKNSQAQVNRAIDTYLKNVMQGDPSQK